MADPSRSETATPRRRQEAREKGQIAKSPDLVAALVMLAGFGILSWRGEAFFANLSALFTRLWSEHGYKLEFTSEGLRNAAVTGGFFFFSALGPLVLGLWVVAVLANVVQFGIVFSGHPLIPKLSNLNPVQGFQRIFSQRMAFEFVKSIVKILILALIGYLTVAAEWPRLMHGAAAGPGGVFLETERVSVLVGLRISAALLFLAALDYAYQRWQFEESLKMTRQEVRDELRQLEGDPLIKARIRQIQREMARRRMFEEVPRADVIITNPEHLAVALRYDGEAMRAPRVVAKGAGVIAERIREIGRSHGVTIVENKPLAQALVKVARIGDEVPPQFYQAVAEVIAYVYQVTRRENLLVPGARGVSGTPSPLPRGPVRI